MAYNNASSDPREKPIMPQRSSSTCYEFFKILNAWSIYSSGISIIPFLIQNRSELIQPTLHL